MAKKNHDQEQSQDDNQENLTSFSTEIKKNIDFILKLEKELEEKNAIVKMKKEEIKDAYKAVAEKLSIKPAILKERINLIVNAAEEPKVLTDKKNTVTFVELYNDAGGIPEDLKSGSGQSASEIENSQN